MERYTIIVQPSDGSRDFWLSSPSASDSDGFSRWVHRSTGAAISVHDNKTDYERLRLGKFDDQRT
jgi:hypothetical protein